MNVVAVIAGLLLNKCMQYLVVCVCSKLKAPRFVPSPVASEPEHGSAESMPASPDNRRSASPERHVMQQSSYDRDTHAASRSPSPPTLTYYPSVTSDDVQPVSPSRLAASSGAREMLFDDDDEEKDALAEEQNYLSFVRSSMSKSSRGRPPKASKKVKVKPPPAPVGDVSKALQSLSRDLSPPPSKLAKAVKSKSRVSMMSDSETEEISPVSSKASSASKLGTSATNKCVVITETVGVITGENGEKIWICPTCKLPDDGSPMIGCDNCDDWYHW